MYLLTINSHSRSKIPIVSTYEWPLGNTPPR